MTPKLTGDRCQCASCKEYFNSTKSFDSHRVGKFSHDQRRCLTIAEMVKKGFAKNPAGFWVSRPLTKTTEAHLISNVA